MREFEMLGKYSNGNSRLQEMIIIVPVYFFRKTIY